MGADHTTGSVIRTRIDHTDPAPQPTLSRRAQLNCMIVNYLGLCLFTLAALEEHPNKVAALLEHLSGENCNEEALLKRTSRLIEAEHEFNRRAGFGPGQDRLPEFMKQDPLPDLGTVFDVPDEALDRLYEDNIFGTTQVDKP
jgi:aldehyde:ferredoxin oxidoreductase